MGGPGNNGNRLPAIPITHKTIPGMIQTHSNFTYQCLRSEVRNFEIEAYAIFTFFLVGVPSAATSNE